MLSAAPNSGLLLVGHGTRSSRGRDELLTTANAVGSRMEIVVEPAFLELTEPTIDDAVTRLADRGVRRMTVMPLLLFAAGHAKRDIPRAAEMAAAKTGIAIDRVAPPLGCHQHIIELSARRFHDAVVDRAALTSADTCLVMVGRGSRDAEATSEMIRFTKLRTQRTPVARVETCFIAMAEPLFDDLLPALFDQFRAAPRCIVVQPHLLFHGELLTRIAHDVERIAAKSAGVDWLVSAHLGADELLVRAVRDVAICRSNSKNL